MMALFLASPMLQKLALYGTIVIAVFLAYFGWKRKIENIGEQKVRLENAHAQAVIAKKIAAAPVPQSRDDTLKLLDDGKF